MNETTKQCPLCAEDIRQAAGVCPYCGARFKISSDGYCLKCHAFRQADESGNCQTCGEPVADWRLESTFIGEALEVTPPLAAPAIQALPVSAPPTIPPAPKPVRWWIFAAVLAGLLLLAGLGWLLVKMTADRFLSQAPVTTPSQAGPLSSQNQATNAASLLPTLTQVTEPTVAPTLAPTPTPILGIGSSMVSDQDGMLLLYVPAGEFLMGSTEKVSKFNNERPQHMVYLDAFWIDQTEVTNLQYSQCVSAGKCPPPSGTKTRTHQEYFTNPEFAQYPVVFISWEGASAYCAWAGRRLPTEAEWEKAARGADGRLFAWGNENPTCELASWGGTGRCGGDTRAAGSAPDGASPYGALDMTGNAWEWVQDWYSPLYYAKAPVENPGGPSSGQDHVLRGGSWTNAGQWLYVTYRGVFNKPPIGDGSITGFRCAMSADESPVAQSAQPAETTASSPPPDWVAAFAGPILENIANRPPNFKDDISNAKNSRYYWGSDPGITFTGGVLHLSTTDDLNTYYGRMNNETADFVLEFDMTPISISSNGGVHVIFRQSDQGYYALGFFQDGSWEIRYSDNTSAEHILARDASDQLGIGKETRVTLIIRDDEMALYLNGLPVGYGSYKAPLANNLNFNLHAPSGTTTVDIDNIQFWNLNNLYSKSP